MTESTITAEQIAKLRQCLKHANVPILAPFTRTIMEAVPALLDAAERAIALTDENSQLADCSEAFHEAEQRIADLQRQLADRTAEWEARFKAEHDWAIGEVKKAEDERDAALAKLAEKTSTWSGLNERVHEQAEKLLDERNSARIERDAALAKLAEVTAERDAALARDKHREDEIHRLASTVQEFQGKLAEAKALIEAGRAMRLGISHPDSVCTADRLVGPLAEAMEQWDHAESASEAIRITLEQEKVRTEGYVADLERQLAEVTAERDAALARDKHREDEIHRLASTVQEFQGKLAEAKALLDSIIDDQWMWTERDVGPVRKARAALDR